MTDAINVELSPAEQAVKYILGRVVTDRNFSWYMFGTESLALCFEAEAARRGLTREDVEQEIVQKAGRDVADISIARERLEAIERLLSSMRARGVSIPPGLLSDQAHPLVGEQFPDRPVQRGGQINIDERPVS